jgi:hypothetical protein
MSALREALRAFGAVAAALGLALGGVAFRGGAPTPPSRPARPG